MADELDQIKKILDGDKSNIKMEYGVAVSGLNMDNTINQVKLGELTYALNAALENFDSSSVNYQNEQGNEFCVQFPPGYALIGTYFINEKNKDRCPLEGLDLLSKMLVYDKNLRITPAQAM